MSELGPASASGGSQSALTDQIVLVDNIAKLRPPPNSTTELRATGLSLLSYAAVSLGDTHWCNAVVTVDDKLDDRGYLSKVDSTLQYFRLANPQVVNRDDVSLGQNLQYTPYLVTAADSTIGLFVSVALFDSWGNPDVALSTDDVLNLTNAWCNEGSLLDRVAESCLVSSLRGAVEDSVTPLPNYSAVQVWGLAHHENRTLEPFNLTEAAHYLWEVSAILQFTSDHIAKDQLWLQQSPSQVVQVAGAASTYLGDHAIFTSKNCCLEISHLGLSARTRSNYRLDTLGYDSTSIFVWTTLRYRQAVLQHVASTYRRTYKKLVSVVATLSNADYADFSAQLAQDQELLEGVRDLPQNFIEQRHHLLANRLTSLDRSTTLLSSIDRIMDMSSRSADRLFDLERQEVSKRQSLLFAVLALLIAVFGIVGAVSSLGKLIRDGHVAELVVACVVLLAIMGVIIRLARRFREDTS